MAICFDVLQLHYVMDVLIKTMLLTYHQLAVHRRQLLPQPRQTHHLRKAASPGRGC